MKKFNIKKILIPLDFSEESMLALQHGAYMASQFGASVILLHAVKPNWAIISIENSTVPMDTIRYQTEMAIEKLDEIAENIHKGHGIAVETLCETGRVCPVIISSSQEHNIDVIVMGTHGASGFEERFIGSNAYRVVNESTCPVITIQKQALQIGFKNIVLPIDHSFYSRQKVNYAIELAQHYGSRIHILGLSNTDDQVEINKLKIKLEQVDAYIEKHGIISDRQIRKGINYAKLTMTYAEEISADLIIIMTEWEEDLTGLFIGPFARQIVNHSRIPVMSIRPEVKPELAEPGLSWMVHH